VNNVEFHDKIRGTLLGTALGDSLGLIAERLTPNQIRRKFGKISRFYVLGDRGFVSDDTEQTALMAYTLARNPADVPNTLRDFRRSLMLWFFCLPFGIGKATIQSCLRVTCGIKNSGVNSAGNGAAMRAAVLGVFLFDQHDLRLQLGTELARVTHTDPRAVEGALFVAELAAILCVRPTDQSLESCFYKAIQVVHDTSLRSALERAAELAATDADTWSAAAVLNGEPCAFILNSLPFSLFCFLRFGDHGALDCLSETVAGGGDTDTNAAIVGGWLGALKGEKALPLALVARIDNGPFGPDHLRQLGDALAAVREGKSARVPSYSLPHSALRNILLVPIIVCHALCRLIPVSANSE
jgi:ADP-ribosyl-[dinitrogen reductase] hydrolase